MARKFLKYDTKNCPSNVDEKGCLTGGGGKEKILLFENVEVTSTNNTISLESVVSAEVLPLLHDESNRIDFLDRYRLVFGITDQHGESGTHAVMECSVNLTRSSQTNWFTSFAYSTAYDSYKNVYILFELRGGSLRFVDMGDKSIKVTCHLEEL